MSEHCGYVVKVEHLRKHENADRLQIATFFGNDTIVGLDTCIGEIGIYFPVDIQLSVEYCNANNLVRRKDENGNNIGGYLDPDKRNIKAVKLRGEKSDGLFMPLGSLVFTGVNLDDINIGDRIEIVNGVEICRKYIPRGKHRSQSVKAGNRTRKYKAPIAPLFAEHADTEQLAYNMDAFHYGDQIEITLKVHGTSQRTGYLPVLKGYKRTIWDKIFRRDGVPIYDWGYVSGTRRVVLDGWDEGGFYGSNAFREQHAKVFEGKLHKGETIYYEVCGFTDTGSPIMASVDNKKISDKAFTKQYGPTTIFSYGCDPTGKDAPQSDMYVYRMTMVNEDGDVIEYSPDFMRYRCAQMGVKCVPVLWSGYLIPDILKWTIFKETDTGDLTTPSDYVKFLAENFYDGPDPIGKTHVREGVVIRIVNRAKFTAYKHKNFDFRVLEGIAKDVAEVPDMEEAQEVTNGDES